MSDGNVSGRRRGLLSVVLTDREETLKAEIREALRLLNRYEEALPRLHRDIRRLLDLANALAKDSKEIWDPIPPLRGNLEAALESLERTEERKEDRHAD